MKKIAALWLLLWLSFAALAEGAPRPDMLGGLEEPAQVLSRGIETLTGYLDHNQGTSPAQLRDFLEREIVPCFDFGHMAYWAAGPLNRYLNPTQRQQLTVMLKERFLQVMVEQLGSYRQSRLQYLAPRGNPQRGNVVLGVRVFGADSYPVQLDFKLYRGSGGWKVYDVMANGASAVGYYRNEFSQLVNRYGVQGFLAGLGG